VWPGYQTFTIDEARISNFPIPFQKGQMGRHSEDTVVHPKGYYLSIS